MQKVLHAGLKAVHIGLRIAKHSTYWVKNAKEHYFGPSLAIFA